VDFVEKPWQRVLDKCRIVKKFWMLADVLGIVKMVTLSANP